ncbi:MAG: hypothetical protein F7B17_07210 [Desulfurococcales archaeon]|nr:hypothetical protein [Desulfurococcales archaeon]
MTLSPNDLHAEGCSVYAVAAFYVRPDRLISRLLKAVESVGGVILDVDEENRVVRCTVSAGGLRRLSKEAGDLLSTAGVEVKVTCRWRGEFREKLKDLARRGFLVERGEGRAICYGVVEGRYVEVEFEGGERVKIKVGRRTPVKSKRLTHKPPPSAYIMNLDESLEAVGEALRVAGAVLG